MKDIHMNPAKPCRRTSISRAQSLAMHFGSFN